MMKHTAVDFFFHIIWSVRHSKKFALQLDKKKAKGGRWKPAVKEVKTLGGSDNHFVRNVFCRLLLFFLFVSSWLVPVGGTLIKT